MGPNPSRLVVVGVRGYADILIDLVVRQGAKSEKKVMSGGEVLEMGGEQKRNEIITINGFRERW